MSTAAIAIAIFALAKEVVRSAAVAFGGIGALLRVIEFASDAALVIALSTMLRVVSSSFLVWCHTHSMIIAQPGLKRLSPLMYP